MNEGIRIVSDGTMVGTKVFNPDGTVMPYVQRVSWSCDAKDGLTRAVITFLKVQVDVAAPAEGVVQEREVAFGGTDNEQPV